MHILWILQVQWENNIKTNCAPLHQVGAFKPKHRMLKLFENSPNLGLVIWDYDTHYSPQDFFPHKNTRGTIKKHLVNITCQQGTLPLSFFMVIYFSNILKGWCNFPWSLTSPFNDSKLTQGLYGLNCHHSTFRITDLEKSAITYYNSKVMGCVVTVSDSGGVLTC